MSTTPAINLTRCESAALVAHGYDPTTKTLAIQFRTGTAPNFYAGVPQEVADGLANAESKGKYMAAHIRGKFSAPALDEASESTTTPTTPKGTL